MFFGNTEADDQPQQRRRGCLVGAKRLCVPLLVALMIKKLVLHDDL
jgi:hypothetical protein